MNTPKMNPVESSNIESIGYDAEKRQLFVKFLRGGTYMYEPVSEDGHRELMKAESKGQYFHQNIKTNETITTTKI